VEQEVAEQLAQEEEPPAGVPDRLLFIPNEDRSRSASEEAQSGHDTV
jgi:hypothetical protein